MKPDQLAALVEQLSPDDLATLMPRLGLDETLGLVYRSCSPTRVIAELVATDRLVQPYGILHGGVYCAAAESACSVGAALVVLPTGRHAVGVENRTRFLRAARPGATLTITATPAAIDGDRHTWSAQVVDADGQVCAVSEVVVRALEPGTRLAGEAVALRDR